MPGRGCSARPGCSHEPHFRGVLEGGRRQALLPRKPWLGCTSCGWEQQRVSGDSHHPGSPSGGKRLQATQLDLRGVRLCSCFNDCDKPGLKLRLVPETATCLLRPQNLGPGRNVRPAGRRALPGPRETLQPPRWAAAGWLACACEGTSGAASLLFITSGSLAWPGGEKTAGLRVKCRH